MPISEWDGCDETHWRDVKALIERAANTAGFKGVLVSQADDVGVIQKRIVQNLYDSPVVVCDISGRNANVMFELGMRLAFDKPTIIIKDDVTPFSFDTSPIEHVTYPRDLRYNKIEEFQHVLSEKIRKSADSLGEDSFLKSFGSFKVADIPVERASIDEIILDEIGALKSQIANLQKHSSRGILPATNRYWPSDDERKPVSTDYGSVAYILSDGLNSAQEKRVRRALVDINELEGVIGSEYYANGPTPRVQVTFDKIVPVKIIKLAKEQIVELLSSFM